MLSQENYQSILIEKRDNGVAIATLNRPERLNAVGGSMHYELTTLPHDVNADPDVKALVITGAGRAFCAGGDFSPDPQRKGPVYMNKMLEPRMVVDNMLDCEKPIISAINGYALGLGATIALLADVTVMAKSAKIGDTHVAMGLSAGDGGQVLWPLLINPARAKYYLMTGEHIPAEEAYRLGLVTFITEDNELMDRALGIADQLASGPLYAISVSKVPINKYMKFVSNMVFPLSLALEEISMSKNDHAEAVKAFQEKRKPQFTGT